MARLGYGLFSCRVCSVSHRLHDWVESEDQRWLRGRDSLHRHKSERILTDIIMVQTEFETSPRSIERVRDFESETQSRHAPRRPGHLLRTSRIETTSSFEPHCYVQVGPDDDLLCSFINTFPVNAFLARADFFFQKRYRHSPTQHYL